MVRTLGCESPCAASKTRRRYWLGTTGVVAVEMSHNRLLYAKFHFFYRDTERCAIAEFYTSSVV